MKCDGLRYNQSELSVVSRMLLDENYGDEILVSACRKMKLCCQFQIFLCGFLITLALKYDLIFCLPLVGIEDQLLRFDVPQHSTATDFGILSEGTQQGGFGSWSVQLEEFCLRNSSVRFPWIMGAFCSCLQPDYSDHHGNHTSSAFRNCMCLRCFTQQLINAV